MNNTLYTRRATFRQAQIKRVAMLVAKHKPVKDARKLLEAVTNAMLRMEVADAD